MLTYLIRESRWRLLAATLACVVSGGSSVLLLAQINAALTSEDSRATLAWAFAGTALLAMLSHMLSSVLFERLSQHAHAELRRFITQRVLVTDYQRLEAIGGPRVHSALSEHSANVAAFFVSLPLIVVNAVVVACCLAYLAWLSWFVFVAALAVIGLGSLGYHLAHLRALGHLDAAAHAQDRLFDHFRSLVEGAKELRLNWLKRSRFFCQVLAPTLETVRHRRALGMSIFVISASWGNFLIYAFIGLVLFVLVGDVPNRTQIMTGFALVFVYMVTPLESLLLNLPRANLARVSAQRIDEITHDMPEPEGVAALMPAPPALCELRLDGVAHRYYHEVSDDMFTLGPIALSFEPAQVSFLVGGNGSGKTTLAKLLVGLYRPEEGQILFNGEPVSEAGRDRYRQNFSAVFADFHLFENLLDTPEPSLDQRGNQLIERLHLQHKVRVKDGAFTTLALSQGQRKRLALVAACLEDRPFLVFDEWAADQDPVFKEVFYREVLPELRARGKTVLVISHDDRYFHLADQLIRLESGQVVSVTQRTPQACPGQPGAGEGEGELANA